MTTVTVGYNKRCWATFIVEDATPEEAALLDSGDEEASAELLRQLDAEGRLDFESEEQDDNPSYFQDWDEPAVVKVDA